MRMLHALRARLRLLARRDAESRMNQEMRFHIDMEAERLVRERGLAPEEARRQAVIAFGIAEQHKDAMRDGRRFAWLAWLGGLSLDLRLGFRMLVKYPGITVIGGIAMAFAVWVGVVTFAMVGVVVNPTLPLPNGDRVVKIANWDLKENEADGRALHDFLAWRRSLTTVTNLGASRDVAHNLITADGNAGIVVGAEVTASAFRIAPDRPLLGRTLTAADERADAPPVVVLGHHVWRTRFASDPQVIGRSVRLGESFATVVGVMPEGFAFPISHEVWTPLRAEALDRGPRLGPGIDVFGHLAPGARLEAAQAELASLGRRALAESPVTHEHLKPRIAHYTGQFDSASLFDQSLMLSINVFAVMLLVLVCGNVALLMFARAATRDGEIVVRSALGASRGRIVAQLFAEALVLGGVATAVGLGAAAYALRMWGRPFLEHNYGRLPFWVDPKVTPVAVLYAIALAALAAVIAGVVPGFKVTRGLGAQLRQRSAGAGGVRFGGVWTAVIVAQVAVTVAFPAIVWLERRELARMQSMDPGFAVEQFLGVAISRNVPDGAALVEDPAARAAERTRLDASIEALRRRVEAEPGVAGVTFIDRMPHTPHRDRLAGLDDQKPGEGQWVSLAAIDPSYFDVVGKPVLAGRAFRAADLAPDARVAIVDRGFIDKVLNGRNPIGRRVRLGAGKSARNADTAATLPFYEIVGVVEDLGMGHVAEQGRKAGLYVPAAPAGVALADGQVHMMVHARGEPMELVPRLRTLAAAIDPSLALSEFQRLDTVSDPMIWVVRMWLRVTIVLSAIALLLSLAGIFAVLSYTVARRTREIGIRVALGASRRLVVAAIFRRPLIQVSLGVLAGGVLVALGANILIGHVPDGGPRAPDAGISPVHVVAIAAYSALMFGVCMLACIVPTRRALSVEPTEALRVE